MAFKVSTATRVSYTFDRLYNGTAGYGVAACGEIVVSKFWKKSKKIKKTSRLAIFSRGKHLSGRQNSRPPPEVFVGRARRTSEFRSSRSKTPNRFSTL